MGRRKLIVISAISALSILTATSGFGQGSSSSHGIRKRGFSRHNVQRNAQFKGARERWSQLSPEDRQAFKRNAERWLQMTPEQRALMRERQRTRRERLRMEAQTVLRDSGLRLDQENRKLFEQRYLQERRRMERELRQEYELRRQQQLERLKKEFQPPATSPGVSSAGTPAISISPNRR